MRVRLRGTPRPAPRAGKPTDIPEQSRLGGPCCAPKLPALCWWAGPTLLTGPDRFAADRLDETVTRG
jgi:hypothetical protein